MAENPTTHDNPLYWSIDQLHRAYTLRDLSPVEVLELALARIEALNPSFNAFLGGLESLAREQALAAEKSFRDGKPGPLCGIPISIKDTFQIEGQETTFGSLVYRGNISSRDCGVVRRLREAGALFTGRTNTAEFGQSATTENRFFDDVRNPWDTTRTTGGSSGGAAASVLAGLSSLALGADGGGSIRIPAAFAGLFGLKPTYGLCKNEYGLAAMSDFLCPGPIARYAADARHMLSVLAGRKYERGRTTKKTRVAWCAHPEARPTEAAIDGVLQSALDRLSNTGMQTSEIELPLRGWNTVFGPLVLAEERRERGHLLDSAELLTDYERKTLQAAERISEADIKKARGEHGRYQTKIQQLFDEFDVILTPTTAALPFKIGNAPRSINGQHVSRTWGAYPFTAAFNVSGNPAVSLPCGFAHNLPVGLQLIAPLQDDAKLLDIAEEFESALQFDWSPIVDKWRLPKFDCKKTASPN